MKQLTQQLKSGKMEILEVPFPALGKGEVLVQNHFSVISAGTEGYQVTEARKGYFAKAKSRQKEVRQVIESVKTIGLLSTYSTVMNKLEAPCPIPFVESYHSTFVTFKAIQSIKENRLIIIDLEQKA